MPELLAKAGDAKSAAEILAHTVANGRGPRVPVKSSTQSLELRGQNRDHAIKWSLDSRESSRFVPWSPAMTEDALAFAPRENLRYRHSLLPKRCVSESIRTACATIVACSAGWGRRYGGSESPMAHEK